MKSTVRKIWNLITGIKNATGNLIFIGLVVFVLIAIFSQETSTVPESAVLILDPQGTIVEQKRAVDPVTKFLQGVDKSASETRLKDVVDAIEFATDDERIKAIAMDLSNLAGSTLSQYEEISKALVTFKETGRPVFAFGDGFSQSQYYLASFADRIYLDKESHNIFGGVFLTGIGAYPLYLKSALDKIHVQMHVFKAGLYKGAAEIYTRDDMSDAAREATQSWIDILWHSYLETIAEQRGLKLQALKDYVNNYDLLLDEVESDPAQLAVRHGLVDKQVTRAEFEDEMIELAGKSGNTYSQIDYRNYLLAQQPLIPVIDPTTDKIAVIVAKGTILDGDQPAGDVGGDSMVELIKQARFDKTTRAIVIRIDSPGGSASASEYIRTELVRTQESGKPVVISMGGYAASGGYWIATSANRIFASRTTVTGSIGTFMAFPTIEQSLDQVGVHADGVGTTEFSDALNFYRPINPKFETILGKSVSRTYKKFISLVAEARGLTLAEVDAIAQGRVWTGASAVELGLVDAIGTIDDAIESAAMLADLDSYDVMYLEKQLSAREVFLQQIAESALLVFPTISRGVFSFLPNELLNEIRVPEEIKQLVRMSSTPVIYLQCLTCRVAF